MATNEKRISMHPDLMFMTSGKTKKNKQPKEKTNDVKIRAPPKTKNQTLRKQSLLRMIRKHQDEKHRQQLQLISGNAHMQQSTQPMNNIMKDTFEFMNNIRDKHINNHTVKNNNFNQIEMTPHTTHLTQQHNQENHSNQNNNSNTMTTFDSNENIHSNTDNTNMNTNTPHQSVENIVVNDDSVRFHVNVPHKDAEPKYGCLKNGSLPTYRSYHTTNASTQKHLPSLNHNNTNVGISNQNTSGSFQKQNAELNALQKYTAHRNQIHDKQKKIIRRTFNVGKNNKEKKISVLISNKKIRSNTTLKLQELKDVSIYQVKKDLIKRGLIRVGCITPESVLRQMYTVVHSMCGSVQNHNSELLLHNYLHTE